MLVVIFGPLVEGAETRDDGKRSGEVLHDVVAFERLESEKAIEIRSRVAERDGM